MNICQIFLRHIPGISRVYHRYRLALYEVNLMHILLISWVYIRQISSISWISPKYLGYILRISQPWVQIQIRYISDSYLRQVYLTFSSQEIFRYI